MQVLRPRLAAVPPLEVQTVVVHGHRRAFHLAGAGPAVLLVHGIGSTLQTWDRVAGDLSRDHLVIAPTSWGTAPPRPRAPTTSSAGTPTRCATC